MKLIFLLMAIAISADALADTYVNGYVKKDGTYVQPHYRTNQDSNINNNYSTQGNVNPYTGQQGNVNPYAMPEIKPYTPPSIYQNKNLF